MKATLQTVHVARSPRRSPPFTVFYTYYAAFTRLYLVPSRTFGCCALNRLLRCPSPHIYYRKVMELLEEKVGSGAFLEALTEVNMEISRKRMERKRQRAVEKATDPVAAAERRRERTEAGKVRNGPCSLRCKVPLLCTCACACMCVCMHVRVHVFCRPYVFRTTVDTFGLCGRIGRRG